MCPCCAEVEHCMTKTDIDCDFSVEEQLNGLELVDGLEDCLRRTKCEGILYTCTLKLDSMVTLHPIRVHGSGRHSVSHRLDSRPLGIPKLLCVALPTVTVAPFTLQTT